MNEVESVTRASAALGSGVRAARKRAKLARKNAKRTRRELARRLPDHTAMVAANARRARDTAQAALAQRADQAQEVLAEHWSPTREALAQRWVDAQDVLAERLDEARHELATRIEPKPRRRRKRLPWLVLLLISTVAAAGAVILARRPRETEPFVTPLAEQSGSENSHPDAVVDPELGDGVVEAEPLAKP